MWSVKVMSVYGGRSGEDVKNAVSICCSGHPRAGSGDSTKVTGWLPRCLAYIIGVLALRIKFLILRPES